MSSSAKKLPINLKVAEYDDVAKRYRDVVKEFGDQFPTATMVKGLTDDAKAKIRIYTAAERNAVLAYLLYNQYIENPTVASTLGVREGQLKRSYDALFDMTPKDKDTSRRARGLALQSALDGKAVDIRKSTAKKSANDEVKRYAKATREEKDQIRMGRAPPEPVEAAKSGKTAGESKLSGEQMDEDIEKAQAQSAAIGNELTVLANELTKIRNEHFEGNMPSKQQQASTNEGQMFKELFEQYRELQTKLEGVDGRIEEMIAAREYVGTPSQPSTPAGGTKIDTETPTIEMTVKKAPKKKPRDDGAGAGAVTQQPSPVTPLVPYGDTPPKVDSKEVQADPSMPTVTATPITAPDPTVRDLHGETIESIDFGNVIPDSTDAENIEDAMLDGKVEKNEPTMDVPMLPNPDVNSVEGALDAMVTRIEEQETETEITDTIRRDATRQTDTILTRQHQQADGSVRDPNVPRVSAGAARAAARGQELSLEQRERVEQMYRNWLANPENAGVPNPYEPMLQALDVAQVGQDAANAADYEGGADDYANIINEGNVGAHSEGDPTLGGGANTDYYYDLSAFEGQGSGGGGAAPQVGQAVMSKLKSAQSAAADVSSGAMERAMQSKSVDQLKQDIQALCMLFASVIPALNSREIQTEKRRVMATSARMPVANFYRKLMQMVKQFYSSDDLKVGVIVSPQSMGAQGGGGGMGGVGGLPGMGSAGYKMNSHGQIEPFSGVQRGDQFVNRGGRHYRDPVRSRVPLNLPEIRPKPVHLQRCMGYANVPFPNIKRAFTTGETFTLKGATQRQAQMADD
jgi:hypothetical protein